MASQSIKAGIGVILVRTWGEPRLWVIQMVAVADLAGIGIMVMGMAGKPRSSLMALITYLNQLGKGSEWFQQWVIP